MQKVKIILDKQSDVVQFVSIANTIEQDVSLQDNEGHCVNAKSLMGCLYSLEFNELYVTSEYENLSSKFVRFLA